MRKSSVFLVVLLSLAMSTGLAFAQRGGPHRGGPGHHGFPGDSTVRPPHGPRDSTIGHHPFGGPDFGARFAVRDSCFQLFLGTIPADSAAMIRSDMATLAASRPIADSLRRQMMTAFRAKDSVGVSATRAELEALHQKIATAAKDLRAILDQYKNELMALRKDCGGMPGPPHRGGPGTGNAMPLIMTPIIPNPVATGDHAGFTYTLGVAADVSITINDVMGTAVQTVFTGNVTDLTPQHVELDLTGLQRGVYVVRVQASKIVQSQKLMVR